MPKEIFVDTGAFVALEDESDQYHAKAIQFRERVLRQENYNIVSSSYVLDETLTLIRLLLIHTLIKWVLSAGLNKPYEPYETKCPQSSSNS